MTNYNHHKQPIRLCWPALLTLVPCVCSLSSSVSHLQHHQLLGDWAGAKAALRDPDCCVVSVSGLKAPLKILQEQFLEGAPADVDLRARVRVPSKSTRDDCLELYRSVIQSGDEHIGAAVSAALEELACGVASLAEDETVEGVFLRLVCASDYRARDPMFHTDKAPLRGYVTLRGVGTEYMTRPCTPLEYATLRTTGVGSDTEEPTKSLRRAPELEFFVMKGDHYKFEPPDASRSTRWLSRLFWKRASACVHRSPPADVGRQRVILSLDLADGDDDREWYEVNKKREWRSGMTQRKSRLVA